MVMKENLRVVGRRMLKDAFIFYLRNGILTLDGGFNQVVSLFGFVWRAVYVCAHVYAGTHLGQSRGQC